MSTTLYGGIVIAAAATLALLGLLHVLRGSDAHVGRREAQDDHLFTVTYSVPHLASGDGHRIDPVELHAVSTLLAQQVSAIAHHVHRHLMETILSQVAADEADAGLEEALTRFADLADGDRRC